MSNPTPAEAAGCDAGLYEVAYTMSVKVRVRAVDKRQAIGKAFRATGGQLETRTKLARGESSSTGWATDISVEECNGKNG